jgi:hypothetical protein
MKRFLLKAGVLASLLGIWGALAPLRPAIPAEPAIAEFLAANSGVLVDEDGEASDWIEIAAPEGDPGGADLDGWSLTDDPALLAKWRFPPVTVLPGEPLVVFASGKDRAIPGSPLHASFKLSSDGEYLAIVRPDGTVLQAFDPAFPAQREDVSYGLGIEVIGPPLVPAGATARFLVPAGEIEPSWTGGAEPFDDTPAAGWLEGPTGIGFDLASDDVPPIFFYDFDDASDPARARDSSGEGRDGTITSHLAYTGSGGSSRPNYTADGAGHTGKAWDRALDFGLRGDGAMVAVPAAAAGAFDEATAADAITISFWAFGSADQPAQDSIFWGSSSADGTGIRSLNAHIPWSDGVIYWDTSGCCDETMRVSKPEPDSTKWKGRWNHYVLVKDGDAKRIFIDGELFLEGENRADLTPIRSFTIGCAPRSGEMSYGGMVDDFAVWDRALSAGQVGALWRGASPLAISSLAPRIGTDVSGPMLGRSASALIRIPFEAPAAVDADALLLRMTYEDGFVAYLNGVEVARRNAPAGALGPDSRAAGPRPRERAIEAEDILLDGAAGLLRTGTNILAIHGLNEEPSSPDFLILPELYLARTSPGRFLRPPTPGRTNGPGVLGFVEEVQFSPERCFRVEPVSVELRSPTPGATVLYTVDGSEPAPGGTGAREYAAPIVVSATTVLRAAAFLDGHEPSSVVAHTYIFPAGVARQPARPAGLLATWSDGWPADYEMDPDVVRTALPGHGIEDAILSIPAVSIAMSPSDLWDPSSGIYHNSSQVWTRAASIELLLPDGDRGFGITAEIRIHGYTSRMHSFTPKHSFRIVFKGAYGPTKLRYPLFPDSEVREFDQIVLRGQSTDSWPVMDGWGGPEPGTVRWFRERSLYLREHWMKDAQMDMGQLACHGFYVNVFLDGLYWGVYELTERPTDSFLAGHLGGEKEEFDVLKDFAEVQSGDGGAWREMMNLAAAGLGTDAAYERIQGNDPDGTRNPALPRFVDVDNLIDYMILHIYSSADDWPNHNWWGGRRRGAESEGFRFFPWDQEITHMDLAYAHTSWGPRYEEVGAYDSPSYLYAQMRANARFRLCFADRVQRHLFGGGALTPQASAARLTRRAEEIDRAIVGESARWGDVRRATPYKREVEWLAELDRLRDDYWPQLHPIAIDRFRRVGLYPSVSAPVFDPPGGEIGPDFELRITGPGVVRYTLDGSDPRSPSGAPSPGAIVAGADPVILSGTATVKARAQSAGIWSALAEARFQVDIPLRITEIMYHPADPPEGSPYDDEDLEFIEVENVGPAALPLAGIRISGAIRFDFTESRLASLRPGEAGVIVRDLTSFLSRYGLAGIAILGVYEGELHNTGERILLEGPAGEAIHDFRWSDRWYPETDGGGRSLVIRDARAHRTSWGSRDAWTASAAEGGSPGADETASAGGLRRPGDWNGDGALDLSDAVGLLGGLFIGGSILPCDGPLDAGGNRTLLDSSGDGRVDLSDAVGVLGYLFLGGTPPARGESCLWVPGCGDACPSS